MIRFRATLEPVPHGGSYVVVPERVAARAGVGFRDRVRGTVRGIPYRSSLARYSGVFHLLIPKASLSAAGAVLGDRLIVALEADREPLPTDTVPEDLARALDGRAGARAAFEALSTAHRRMRVKHVLEAARPETRLRRIGRVVEALSAGAGRRPPGG